jgi:hypothetical protein
VSELEKDFTLQEVADALGMSERWLRQQVKAGAVHNRYGHKIRFTTDQVEKLRGRYVQAPAVEESVTTGRKRGRS